MAARRRGLGSGLDALIPPKRNRTEEKKTGHSDHTEDIAGQAGSAQEKKSAEAKSTKQEEKSAEAKTAKQTKKSAGVKTGEQKKGSAGAKATGQEENTARIKSTKQKANTAEEKSSEQEANTAEEKLPKQKEKSAQDDVSVKEKSAVSQTDKASASVPKEEKSAAKKETESTAGSKGKETTVPIDRVEPNRNQPRKEFDRESLKELADSISEYGILQPLLVTDKKDYYQIIAGERRWRAAKLAGLKEVPVIVRELTDQEIVEISLIENIQREDLNPIEEAHAYRTLIEEFQLKQSDVAKRVSKSRTVITNSMRLLKLDQKVQQMLIDGKLSVGHARALIALEDPALQVEVAEQTAEKKLSVREVEQLIRSLLHPKKTKEKKKESPELEHLYRDLEEQMKLVLGTKVEIKNKGKQGKIEISYFSQEELDHILLMLKSIDQDI